MTLNEIALHYKTDKSSLFHNYTEKYEKYFSPLRNEPLKILEIGIQNGYSLKTWNDYFPNAHIFGIDIVDCRHMDEGRIKTLQGSQTDTLFLEKINNLFGPFDIIIDDGSHYNNDMRISFDCLFPLLKQGGLYVVEDLHCCYWKDFANGTSTFIDRLKELMDAVNGNGKCGLADLANINDDIYYQKRTRGEMDWWEKNIEFIHLYRSIVFIKKNTFGTIGEMPEKRRNTYSLVFKVRNFIKRILKSMFPEKKEQASHLTAKVTTELSSDIKNTYRLENKIYDCFIFFNELDLLEIRFNILDAYVDYFVVVEATETFSGKPKPLYFKENKERFKKWEHKIIYYETKDTPQNYQELEARLRTETDPVMRSVISDCLTSDNIPKEQPHWLREFYQREILKKVLSNLNDNDICYLSDLDEIWNPHANIDYREDAVFKLKQDVYAYYLNNKSNEVWAGTVVTKYKNIKESCLNHLRGNKKTKYTYIENGGWHFTNQGGASKIKEKLESYGHQEFNTDKIKDTIEKRMADNKDFIGRNFKFRVDESTLPNYLLTNRKNYSKLFK